VRSWPQGSVGSAAPGVVLRVDPSPDVEDGADGEAREEGVRTAARLSAPGSTFACDTIGPGIFKFPYTREFLARLEAADSPWRWGDDDVRGLMESCGWTDIVVTEPGNPSANYGRWPSAASPVDIPSLPRIYLTRASVAR
jgi:hypothetical protein